MDASPRPGAPAIGYSPTDIELKRLDFQRYPFPYGRVDLAQFETALSYLQFHPTLEVLNLAKSYIPGPYLNALFNILAKRVERIERFSFSVDPFDNASQADPRLRASTLLETLREPTEAAVEQHTERERAKAAQRLLRTATIIDFSFIDFNSDQFRELLKHLNGAAVQTLYLGYYRESQFVNDCLRTWTSAQSAAASMNLPSLKKVIFIGADTDGPASSPFIEFKKELKTPVESRELLFSDQMEHQLPNQKTVNTVFDDIKRVFVQVPLLDPERSDWDTALLPEADEKKAGPDTAPGPSAQQRELDQAIPTAGPLAQQPLHLTNLTDWSHTHFDMSAIHQQLVHTKGEGIRVAIIDSGIDIFHPHLLPRIARAVSFVPGEAPFPDPQSHGTHCAGIVLSIAPDANLYIAKVLPFDPLRNFDWSAALASAIRWAIERDVKVINLSLGLPQSPHALVHDALHNAAAAGITIVSAAINQGAKYRYSIGYPAKFGVGLCVGSHDPLCAPSSFSSIGRELDFLAPGQDVLSTVNGGAYSVMSGSSMAAPFISGLVASLLSFENNLIEDPNQRLLKNSNAVRIILRCMASKHGDHDQRSGYGSIKPQRFFYELWAVTNVDQRRLLYNAKFASAEN